MKIMHSGEKACGLSCVFVAGVCVQVPNDTDNASERGHQISRGYFLSCTTVACVEQSSWPYLCFL